MRLNILDDVQIAAPCSASWDGMAGDERVRHCSQCGLNVYNVTEMRREEAERLLLETEGRMCIRLYRRRDGTVLTRDCPRGVAAIRRRVVGWWATVAAALGIMTNVSGCVVMGQTVCPEEKSTTSQPAENERPGASDKPYRTDH